MAPPVISVKRNQQIRLLLGNVSIAENRIDCKSMPAERFLLRNKKRFSLIFDPFPYRYPTSSSKASQKVLGIPRADSC